ncbi:LAME_0F14884g1_1 [Lachancea meyersii CBS 8951]|uniref:Coatomer subunit epsilon n=1 Tax=Lachancea meyersii CBS 8951 TaxID=1266667 RepID=A0A1G4JYH2_9SACH|nr:LAME_0F14884g1_1 [Lachancea meyersii CBS 8951]
MNFFSVKQQYYTGNFKAALSSLEKHPENSSEIAEFYKAKCLQALDQLSSFQSQSALGPVFEAYTAAIDTGDLANLEKAASNHKSLFALNLLATAQATQGQLESALETCNEALAGDLGPGATELALLAVQVSVMDPRRASVGAQILQNFLAAKEDNYANEDEIIVNFAESYVNFALGREVSGSNFYFFEELSQTLPCWKTQLALLSSHLQQSNLPEAQTIVDLLDSEFYQNQTESAKLYTPEFIANKITLAAMQGEHVDALRDELLQTTPNHPLCRDYKTNNAKFDEIIAKYA